jgi:pimeloyl-ACP methyl ester carboxylesterase
MGWRSRQIANAPLADASATPCRLDRRDAQAVGNRPDRSVRHELGRALAQEFALRYPSMVRRLILAATSAGPVMLVKPADIVGFFDRNQSAKQRKQEGSRNSIQTLLRFGVVKGMLTVNPRTYYHQLAALVGWTSLLRLYRLRQRTLILTGDRDTLVLM